MSTTEVFRTSIDPEAQVVRSALEGRGIKAHVVTDNAGGFYPLPGGIRVIVAEEDSEEAKAIIADLVDGDPHP